MSNAKKPTSFSALLRAHRVLHQVFLYEVAARVDVPPEVIGKIEREVIEAPPELRRRLAVELSLPYTQDDQ